MDERALVVGVGAGYALGHDDHRSDSGGQSLA